MERWPPSGSRSRANTLGESKSGGQSHSTPPERPTIAAVWQSPSMARSPIVSGADFTRLPISWPCVTRPPRAGNAVATAAAPSHAFAPCAVTVDGSLRSAGDQFRSCDHRCRLGQLADHPEWRDTRVALIERATFGGTCLAPVARCEESCGGVQFRDDFAQQRGQGGARCAGQQNPSRPAPTASNGGSYEATIEIRLALPSASEIVRFASSEGNNRPVGPVGRQRSGTTTLCPM